MLDRTQSLQRPSSQLGNSRLSAPSPSHQLTTPSLLPSGSVSLVETEHALDAMVRKEHEWLSKFPEVIRPDIEFLLNHPTGRNLKTHQCMGVAHTDTFRTADHTRVTPHILLASEIALEMAERLGLPLEDSRNLVAAVAGHDQGHIFASHQSEIAINTFPEFDGTAGRAHFCHEKRTRELFDSDDFRRHFGEERLEQIKTILYEQTHPLHLIVDWSDRLAYLIADSLHLGHHDIIANSHVRRELMSSLAVLPDGTIGFSSLDAVRSLISARELLYRRVSIGSASALFTGFLIEAYHRAVAQHKITATEFVRLISERSTPEARKLFAPKDIPRLYCPQQEPTKAKPVDRDYRAICHITLDMLTDKGRQWALTDSPLPPNATVPACSQPRASMTKFEHHLRSSFALSGGQGYLDRLGAVVGISHIAPKHYSLRTLDAGGSVVSLEQSSQEKWEFFIAVPKELGNVSATLHREACQALAAEGLITAAAEEKIKLPPPTDFFTRY